MADFHLVDYSTLTSEQKTEYYKWLIANADRAQELYDEKLKKSEEVNQITKEKSRKIQENLEYYRTLKMKVLNKKAERKAMTDIVSKMCDATKAIEVNLKDFEHQRDRVAGSCDQLDEMTADMKEKLKIKQESALNAFNAKTEAVREAKIADRNAAYKQVEENKQLFETSKIVLDQKLQDLEYFYAKLDDVEKQYSDANAGEVFDLKNALVTELNDKISIRDEKLRLLDEYKNELDEIAKLAMELLNTPDKTTQIQDAIERNKVKFKEVECAASVAQKALSKKFETMVKDLENTIKDHFDQVKAYMLKRDEHITGVTSLKETYSAQQQEIKNIELEKKEVQLRIGKAKGSIETNKAKRDKFDADEKEKIYVAKAKIAQLEIELKELQRKYREKFTKIGASQELIAEIEKLFYTQSSGAQHEDSNASVEPNSTSSSDNKPPIKFKDLSAFNISQVIELLDPVTSNESVLKPKA